MGIFDFLKPFISEKKFERNIKGQKDSADRYLDLLGKYDKRMEEPKEMEFFFYSKTRVNANELKKDLEKIGYEVYGIERSTKNQYSIIGVTPPISLEGEKFKKWIKKMNEIGFINDCNFDGWGTISFLD
ncbi:MAG: ribonuclease E inhibitor RraB [Cyclobacteriaceae bacterium]|nr:ribonuclease E inhibitor RraB [Cyclobacteriaceae bacterium]MCK5280576.1 ribonuclease E inhibitor RraB [Cyclobacteriaceae bacterium]